jgi:carbon starvation protein CstA
MFEALFILTTIDAGTRIGRFLLQELGGKLIHPKVGQTDWWPSTIVSTLIIVIGWAYFINANSMAVIWPMFGVANQMLAVIALAVVSVYLVNEGKGRYLWVTVGPMIIVFTTTSTAALQMFQGQLSQFLNQLNNTGPARNVPLLINSGVQGALILAMLACAIIVIIAGATKVLRTTGGLKRGFEVVAAESMT